MVGQWLPKPLARVRFPDGALQFLRCPAILVWCRTTDDATPRSHARKDEPLIPSLSGDYRSWRAPSIATNGSDAEPAEIPRYLKYGDQLMSDFDELTLVPEPSKQYLNPRQLQDYRAEREDCLTWLFTRGKEPDKHEGYALSTLKSRGRRMDRFYRWIWDEEGGYTVNITNDHADAWLKHLARQDMSGAHKSNFQKALQALYKWRHHERGAAQWEPSIRFSESHAFQPRDYFTREERAKLREAALEYGSVPSYDNLSPDQRDRWKTHLAQRFEKPKAEVRAADWERANGWKIPSLVWTSLDVGLRPVKVRRAKPSWVDVDNHVLRIPKSDSAKSHENWVVGVRERTAEVLGRWIDQRKTYPKYDDEEHLWLTQKGNPYKSASLKYTLMRLCEIAGIETETRQLSWYAIRHSVGTYMAREEDLAAAQAQLRHKSPRTTMRYDQTPVEDRRDALNRMG